MKTVFALIRSTVFLGWLSFALASVTVTTGIWAIQMGSQVAVLTKVAVETVVTHRKSLARAVARAKAKARLRRFVVAIPIVGLGTVVYFEESDYREWKEENPDGDRAT